MMGVTIRMGTPVRKNKEVMMTRGSALMGAKLRQKTGARYLILNFPVRKSLLPTKSIIVLTVAGAGGVWKVEA